jgi:hypothetical protein
MKTVDPTQERGGKCDENFQLFFLQNLVKISLENKESSIKYAPFYFCFCHLLKNLLKNLHKKKGLIYEIT